MPAERPPTKASENRRATKPIMEKRRRARINQCLSELKALILDALNKDPSRHSKLEKADILEMTVRHLQNIQRQQMAAAISTDPSVLNKFKAGFNECASEVSRYIGRIEGVDPALRQRLLAHLSNCMTTMNAASTTFQPPTSASLGFTGTFPGMMSSLQSLSVQIPGNIASLVSNSNNSRSDINNNTNGHPSPISSTSSTGKLFGGLPLIPSRLPNGDFAFLLPSHALSQQQSCQLFGLPSGSASSSLPSQSSAPDRTSNSSWPPDSPSSRRSASPATSDNSALSPTGSDGGSDVFVDSYGSNKHHMQHKDVVVLSASSVPSSVIRRTPPVVVMRQDDVDRDNDHHHLQHHHSLRSQQPVDGESVWRPW